MPPPTPDTPPAPAPHRLPPRGRELLVQGLRRIIIGIKNRNNRRKIGRIAIKIEKNRRNRDNRRIEIIENNRK